VVGEDRVDAQNQLDPRAAQFDTRQEDLGLREKGSVRTMPGESRQIGITACLNSGLGKFLGDGDC